MEKWKQEFNVAWLNSGRQSGQFRTISAETPKIFRFGTLPGTRNTTETYVLKFWGVSAISVCFKGVFGLMNNLIFLFFFFLRKKVLC